MVATEHRAHRRQWRCVAALTLLALVAGPAANAEPKSPTHRQVKQARAAVADKKAQVAKVEAQLAAANRQLEQAATKAEQAAEAYNGAEWELQQATTAAAEAEQRAKAAERRVGRQHDQIVALVTDSYEGVGQLTAIGAMFSADGPETLMSQYLSYEGASNALQAGYAKFAAASAVARSFRQQAEDALAAKTRLATQAKAAMQRAQSAANSAQAISRSISARKATLVKELAAAQSISVKLARERQKALEEKAAEAAAAKAAAEAAARQRDQAGPGGGGGSTPPTSSDPPAPNSRAQKAIDFAKAQLGDPYQWGAAGPDSWDCSGLTMGAWGAAGVSLPHYAASQYYDSTPISVNQLQPGDLVFWGTSNNPDSIHHVAIYLGNGQIIHAPRTGEDVQIDNMYYWTPPNFFGRV